jgi:hypothetical protein
MTCRTLRFALISLSIAILLPSLAAAEGLSYRGWGPRVGVSVDPDQLVAGIQIDLGELAKKLRFQPNFDVGYGDDALFIGGYLGAYWFFQNDGSWDFYAGADLGVIYENFDIGGSDLDVAFNAVGGIETRLQSNNRFLIELKIGLVEEPDFKLMVGWTF